MRAASASSIQVDFRYRGVRCREKLRLDPTPANLRYAAKLKARIEHEIAVGTFDYAHHFPDSDRARNLARNPAAAITVGELLTEWLAKIAREVEPETYGDYKEYVERTWRPRFGKLRLCDLTLARVQTWVAEQTASRKRILNLLTPLRQSLRYAVNVARLLPADPLANLEVTRPDQVEDDRIDPFTPAEIASVLPALPEPVQNMVTFWCWTGLRFGELVALTWADVDLDKGVVRITKAKRGARTKAPKTRAGRRELRLLPPALEALRRQRAHTQLIGREVFQNPAHHGHGGARHAERIAPWSNPLRFRELWKAACGASGVRYRFPRQCRHTFASWMLSSGESPLWVARMMGHSDWSQIVKTYGRWIPEVDPEAGMRAVRAITKAS